MGKAHEKAGKKSLFISVLSGSTLGSGNGMQPFKTVQDYDNFLKRLDGFVEWSDQAIVNMREGMNSGVVHPKALMVKVLPQFDALIKDKPEETLFWGPIQNMPKAFQIVTYAVPLRYYVQVLRGVFLKDAALRREFLALLPRQGS